MKILLALFGSFDSGVVVVNEDLLEAISAFSIRVLACASIVGSSASWTSFSVAVSE